MIRVLFVCTGNSARSQMAEGLLRWLGADRFDARSAGTEPKGVNPLAVRAMDELGIDISRHESKSIDRYMDQSWDYVITVCDRAAESCPVFASGRQRLHWSFPDPASVSGPESVRMEAFRSVRDAMAERIRQFVMETAGLPVDI